MFMRNVDVLLSMRRELPRLSNTLGNFKRCDERYAQIGIYIYMQL